MDIFEKDQRQQNERFFAAAEKVCGCRKQQPETLEGIIKDLHELEADRLVRLADEEQDLRECLREIRDGLRKKQQRGRELEAMGVTIELVRRYRKDYGDTDWGC